LPINVKLTINVVFLAVVVAAAVIVLPLLCHKDGGSWDTSRAITWLKSHGYTAVTEKPDHKPESLPPEVKDTATASAYGAGNWIPDQTYTPEDTVSVELSTVELPDGLWARVTIDGKPIEWEQIDYHREEIQRNWTAFVELTAVSQAGNDTSQIGIGVGYRIWQPLGVNVVPSVAVSTDLRWIAPELRITRNVWSGVSVGGGVGYRIGDGLHLSVGVGVEL